MILAITLAKVSAFVAIALVVGPRVLPWLLREVARTGSRELFTLAVLAMALGIAFAAAATFDISFALGAFFAGMVLNKSELSHKAATNSLPLQDAFGVLFFVSVGMLFDPSILVREPVMVAGVLARIPETLLTGHPTQRLSNSASFSFRFVEGEGILLNLDMLGICGSSGSACTSANLEPSHVLTAMGIPVEDAHGSLRLSLGRSTTKEDVALVLEHLPGIVQKLREMSPIYDPTSCPPVVKVV